MPESRKKKPIWHWRYRFHSLNFSLSNKKVTSMAAVGGLWTACVHVVWIFVLCDEIAESQNTKHHCRCYVTASVPSVEIQILVFASDELRASEIGIKGDTCVCWWVERGDAKTVDRSLCIWQHFLVLESPCRALPWWLIILLGSDVPLWAPKISSVKKNVLMCEAFQIYSPL